MLEQVLKGSLLIGGPSRPAVSPVRTVTGGQEVFPGVEVQITGGHTTGHAGTSAGTARLAAP
ncbi:hypothetical protein [Nonomuraea dietziae]|uniref:Glyoxylase-like metal-dependent hydrolase (Beta-lactamase superfamily II) n=1 Tax=Nonomuraea dietziae TaxID=65515 RepID=A0A7W5YLR8_9ACTN|nr:hypothetical protein [Nonomuraea dietziae]MBB3725482.1 glyoxylase-like metal-dependent hydrolase (beta-lactamase superfamily II) [Nonomuraea dietziae]